MEIVTQTLRRLVSIKKGSKGQSWEGVWVYRKIL